MSLLSRQRRRDDVRVRIVVDGLAPLDAEVVQAVEGAVELALGRSSPVPGRFLHRRPAELIPVGAHEGVAVRLLAVPDGRGRVDDTRLCAVVLLPEPPRPDPGRLQRRRHVRVPVFRPVTLVPVRFDLGWLNGMTHNVSAGGALVVGVEGLIEGERLRTRLPLDEQQTEVLDLASRVVRTAPQGRNALVIERVTPEDRERLVRWVRQRELELIRRLQRL